MTQALQELEAQLRDLNIKLSEAKQKEKQAALAAFKEQVELLGISQQEVLSALGYIVQRKRKAPAKYYDPTTGRSWSGRGPGPNGSKARISIRCSSNVRRRRGGPETIRADRYRDGTGRCRSPAAAVTQRPLRSLRSPGVLPDWGIAGFKFFRIHYRAAYVFVCAGARRFPPALVCGPVMRGNRP